MTEPRRTELVEPTTRSLTSSSTRTRLARIALLALAIQGSSPAQTPLYVYEDPVGRAGLGTALVGLGDVDGDDRDDFAISAPSYPFTPWESEVQIYSGASGALIRVLANPGTLSNNFGRAMANLGDVDGDGVEDLAVGAHRDSTAPFLQWPGAVFVYSGQSGALLYTVFGDSIDHELGYSVDAVDDLDGDGVRELVAGHSGADFSDPRVGIYSGSDGSPLMVIRGTNSSFGTAVSGLGDLSGDGFGEIAIGDFKSSVTATQSGSVWIYSGSDGSLLREHHESTGDSGAQLGRALANAGDVDGDGLDDLVVGAPGWTSGNMLGKAVVLSGADGTTLHEFFPGSGLESMGRAVAGGGDLDGDGHADILVGSPFSNVQGQNYRGRARIYSGKTGAVLFQRDALADELLLGSGLAFLGDVSGDGLDDFGIGAPHESYDISVSPDPGRAYVFDLEVGRPFCGPVLPNSTGLPGRLGGQGSRVISDQSLRLTCSQLPPGAPTLLVVSPSNGGNIVFTGGARMCLGHPRGLLSPTPLIPDGAGLLLFDLDPDDLGGLGTALPGASWYYQALYSDPAAIGTSYLTTNALRLRFK